jgi:hypothetical protein
MRFSEEKEGGGIQGWNLPFDKVTGISFNQEGLLTAWTRVQEEGSPDSIATLGTQDVKKYVDEYAVSQGIQEEPSALIKSVEVRALGNRNFPELAFFVEPVDGLSTEQESLLSNSLFPLS